MTNVAGMNDVEATVTLHDGLSRLAGTVHGTIDGAPTEIELRGAYLFHLDRQRITKFNLAVREKRTASVVVPGLDIVAQVKMTIFPAAKKDQLGADVAAQASDTSIPMVSPRNR